MWCIRKTVEPVWHRSMKMNKRLEHLTHIEMTRRMKLFSLNERKLWGILAMYINIQWERMSKKPPDPSQQHPLTQQGAMAKFSCTWENFISVRVIRHWNRLSRTAVEILKTQLNTVLGNLL